jgi:hypothetical protein
MTPATLIGRLDAAIAGYGQSVTLQRTAVDNTTGGVTVAAEVTCPAKFRTFGPQDLAAGEVQDISVIISPTALGTFGMPSRDDRIVLDGNPSNIEQIAPLYYGGQLVRLNLLCRG